MSLCKNSFLEVMAVSNDEQPEKDGQRGGIRDIVTRRNVLCLTVPLNQSSDSTIDCTIHIPEILQTFSLVSKVYCDRCITLTDLLLTISIKAAVISVFSHVVHGKY